MHVLIDGELAENAGGIIFMHHVLIDFPDVDRILSDRKQDRDIFLRDDMSLTEYGILGHAPDDLCNIMAQDLSDSIFCFD